LPSPYRCPACNSKDIIEYDEIIECTQCNLEFFKEHLGEIDPENLLSAKELHGIVGAFDEHDRMKLQKDLKDERSDNDEEEQDYYDT